MTPDPDYGMVALVTAAKEAYMAGKVDRAGFLDRMRRVKMSPAWASRIVSRLNRIKKNERKAKS